VLADYFTPYNELALNLADMTSVCRANCVARLRWQRGASTSSGCGKQGWPILRSRPRQYGHFNAGSDSQIVQTVSGVGGCWSTPGYFNGTIYFVGTATM